MTLTKKQQQVFDFIKDYLHDHGIAPTIHEIREALGTRSPSMVHRHIQALIDKGWLAKDANRSRSLSLAHSSATQLPILGSIPAGNPVDAVPIDDYFDITHQLAGNNRFLLKVSGDSMIGDNICDGDYVLCQRIDHAENNSIVVALIDHEEVTLKHIQQHPNGTVTLIPSNEHYQPRTYDSERIKIQGVYLGLIRL